jgi:hypothetical protein
MITYDPFGVEMVVLKPLLFSGFVITRSEVSG